VNADVLSAIGSANLKAGASGPGRTDAAPALDAMDADFVPALNNLGVVLMERAKPARRGRVFQRAFALDSGNSDSIRENLRLAIARTENRVLIPTVRHQELLAGAAGQGQYLLLSSSRRETSRKRTRNAPPRLIALCLWGTAAGWLPARAMPK
jgi:hypothetical protein